MDDDPRRLGRVLLLDLGQAVVLDSLGDLVLFLTHDDHPERKVSGRLVCRSVLRSGGRKLTTLGEVDSLYNPAGCCVNAVSLHKLPTFTPDSTQLSALINHRSQD